MNLTSEIEVNEDNQEEENKFEENRPLLIFLRTKVTWPELGQNFVEGKAKNK